MSNGSENEVVDECPTTKICQYCFEPIRLEAVKCKFCGSSLAEPNTADSRSEKNVVYIVDRDLIRFAKFSVAILALITIVGALLYGVDIKQLRKDIEIDKKAIMDENRILSKELATTLERARKIDFEVKGLRSKIEEDNNAINVLRQENNALAEKLNETLDNAVLIQIEIKDHAEVARANARRAEVALAGIHEMQQMAAKKFNEIVIMQDGSLTIPQQTATVTSASNQQSAPDKLWPNGTTLHVRFLGGNSTDHAKVEGWAKKWTEYANIRFNFDNDPNAEIRISFDANSGSWSYSGRDGVTAVTNADQATMNLGWLDEPNVLTQFGYVLGLQPEHRNPYEPVPWNKDAVYAYFENPPNNWSRDQIDYQVLRPYNKDAYPIPKPFDPKSIMLHVFPNDLTNGDFRFEANKKLSEGDKAFVAKLYPKT